MLRKYLPIILLLLFPLPAAAQLWSGIIDPARAIDWTSAGVNGGIPSASWTQSGSTIAAGASAATIQSALNACGTNHYVQLGSGTFTLNNGLSIPSNCVLRGNGANNTLLTMSGSASYYWGQYAIGFIGNYDNASDNGAAPGFGGCAGTCRKITLSGTNGSAGVFTKGATILNLASTPTGLSAGMMLMLVQNDTSSVAAGYQTCSATGIHCSREGSGYTHGTGQRENFLVVSVAGTSVTVTPPLYYDNIATARSPIVYYQACCEVRNAGVENLRVNLQTNHVVASEPISFFQAEDCWASGVAVQPYSAGVGTSAGDRTGFTLRLTRGITVQNSWVDTAFGGGNSSTTSYGMESVSSTGFLYLNNIYNKVESPILISTGSAGYVLAYNYIPPCPGSPCSSGETGILAHEVGNAYSLWEGNEVSKYRFDVIHGTADFTTIFRGWTNGNGEASINDAALDRYTNILANVLGASSPVAYQVSEATNGACGTCDRFNTNVYRIGYPDDSNSLTGLSPGNVAADAQVATTMFRYGNYDTSTVTVRFQASEVPSGISPYANAVPGSTTFPPSFYYSAKPNWFPSAKAWPLMGPDVTGGNISGYAGHAYTTVAHDCYTSISGAVASFNADTCYPISGASQVATPTFSLPSSPPSYNGPQTVTFSSTTGGATFCSTIDGSTPTADGAGTCTHGTTGASIVVSATATVKVIGTESGFTDSAVATASYTIIPIATRLNGNVGLSGNAFVKP